jgi:hypothetical protein
MSGFGICSLRDRMENCCKYASAVCYSLWLYYGMLLEDYMDRVSGRLLTEILTLLSTI